MAALKPETGLVFRYDFLFKEDRDRGLDSGKDRPCAIMVATEPNTRGARNVLVAPITHTPPMEPRDGVEIPHKLARHLGLDDALMWVKTNDLNRFVWDEGRLPFGVTPVSQERPAYGVLPDRLHRQIADIVLERAKEKTLTITDRDALMERYEASIQERAAHREERFKERDRDIADDD